MSESQLNKVEDLLGLITSPRSKGLKQPMTGDLSEENSVDVAVCYHHDKEGSSVKQAMSQLSDGGSSISEQDTVACHEFVADVTAAKGDTLSDNKTENEVDDSVMEFEVHKSQFETASESLSLKINDDMIRGNILEPSSEALTTLSETVTDNKVLKYTEPNPSTEVREAPFITLPSNSSLQTNQEERETAVKHVNETKIDKCLSHNDIKNNINLDFDLLETNIYNARKERSSDHDMKADLHLTLKSIAPEEDIHEKEDKVEGIKKSQTDLRSAKAFDGLDLVEMDGLAQDTKKTMDLFTSKNLKIKQDPAVINTGDEGLKLELKKSKDELASTKSQLARITRQLEKANSYNEDLRKQVESLSAEIHRYRHMTTKDREIQVDKEELTNYAAGEMIMPDWGTMVHSDNTTADTNAEQSSHQTGDGDKVSIAESLKATAEAVVLQQSGFVYDENSGLYYDYNSGYYYDSEKSLYYDPNSGTYFYYNHETNEYQFHSQVDVTCYQWQHQSQTASSQHGGSGENTLQEERYMQSLRLQSKLWREFSIIMADSRKNLKTKQPQKHSVSDQHQIVSKEKLKKTERNRKKERKKEKDKDGKIFKNRKDRRKELREKIAEKRKKKEKEGKKHHRHKKRKRHEKEKDEKDKNDKYVEEKMRKRLKKKKRHKRKKDRDDVSEEVIEVDEDINMQSEAKDIVYEIEDIDEESVLVIDENAGSPTDIVCDIENSENKVDIDLEPSSNDFSDNLTVLAAQKVNNGTETCKGAQNNVEYMEYDDTLGKNASIASTSSEVVFMERPVNQNLTETKGSDNNENAVKTDTLVKDKTLAFEDKLKNEGLGRRKADENDSGSEFMNENADACDVPVTENKKALKVESDTCAVQGETDELSNAGSDNNSMISSESGEAVKEVADSNIVISSESEMESGELTESENSKSESDSFSDNSSDSSPDSLSSESDLEIWEEEETDWRHSYDLAGGWPPCIRVIVTESNCLSVGTLFIVTCTGGTIGREKDMNHTIRIPDIGVSKMHAEIKFESATGQYKIIDWGSQNGTFINDQRIGEIKEVSAACPINHGDSLQLGDTKLLCHIHSGSDTCDLCEPGIVMANHIAKQPQKRITILSREEKKQQHKQQLKEIKKKYGLKNAAYVDNSEAINNPLYTDKASERRRTAGTDEPEVIRHEPPASVHRPISSENIGHKLLKKMGWSEGESLGKENSGIQEPVTVSLRANQTAGLGSSTGVFSPDDANSVSVKKAARRVQAQQRFNKLQNEKTGNQPNSKNRSQSGRQWTKGETQFTEGSIS